MTAPAPVKEIGEVEFYLLSPDEIHKLSCCAVTDSRLYVHNLPREGGLLDTRMGTVDSRMNCATCLRDITSCVGHPGHIDLAEPCYHIYYADVVLRLLQCVCYFCSSFLVTPTDPRFKKLIRQVKSDTARFAAICKLSRGKKTCPTCESPQPEYAREGLVYSRLWPEDTQFFDDTQASYALQPFLPSVARDILTHIDPPALKLLKIKQPENMIMPVLLVPAPIIRPSVSFSSGSKAKGHDDLTRQLMEIVKKNDAVKNVPRSSLEPDSPELVELMHAIANYMNNGAPNVPKAVQRSGVPMRHLTQRIKGKRGRIRGNLSGKRTNNSGRCVITPDSNLDIDQIGVPKLMALNLLFPEKVNAINLAALTARVRIGPKHVDGARYVIDDQGTEFDLKVANKVGLQIGYTVVRPLKTGDYVIVNRNPSLHKKSLMAFRVIILPGNTLRLNLSVTTPLNADFDGDECTLHVVSDYESRAELQEIMHVSKQILNPQSNRATMGLVQDALVGAFLLTGKDIFLDREVFMDMVMWLNYRPNCYELPVPAILKPRPLWTGKQLFAMSLPGVAVNLHQVVRNGGGNDPMDPEERWILIRHGELVAGRLCKATLGPSAGGLVHILAKDYGLQKAADFLSDSQRMITNWITYRYGFSVGLNDCVVPVTIDTKIKNIIQRAYDRIDVINSRATEFHASEIEAGVSQLLQKILELSGRAAQASLSGNNAIMIMTQAGSKGNVVNLSQITAAIGLQLLESRRVPLHPVTGRSLAYYPPNTNTAASRAFVSSNFFTGLTAPEMFFHTATGREGLVDSAVRTANVGYMNRRTMKAAESIHVAYDSTLRNAQKYIIDYKYGGSDSMDAEMLERVKMSVLEWDDSRIAGFFQYPSDVARILALRDEVRQMKKVGFLPAGATLDTTCLVPVNIPRVIANLASLSKGSGQKFPVPVSHEAQLRHLMWDLPHATAYWRFWVATCLAATHIQPHFDEAGFTQLCTAIEAVYHRSLVQYGEAVGALCAQSIGEPTTQMTLNSFHQSGLSKGAVHVGMPRLEELTDCNAAVAHSSATIVVEPGFADWVAAHCVYSVLEDVVTRTELRWKEPEAWIPEGASRWILILYLRPSVLQERMLGIRDIVAAIRDLFAEEEEENVNGWVEYFTEPNNLAENPPQVHIRPYHLWQLASSTPNPREANRILLDDFRSRSLSKIELRGIPGITNAWTRVMGGQQTVVETEGTALAALMQFPHVSPLQTYSNNVNEIADVLGLEAAIFMLFQELRHIFVTEGTNIDERHYLTLVNIMSFRGYLVPLRRHGLNALDTGPLCKATFEKTMDTFKEGCLFRIKDRLQGPSESVLFTQRIPLGTGMVTLISPNWAPSAATASTTTAAAAELVQTTINKHWSRSAGNGNSVSWLEYRPTPPQFVPQALPKPVLAIVPAAAGVPAGSWQVVGEFPQLFIPGSPDLRPLNNYEPAAAAIPRPLFRPMSPDLGHPASPEYRPDISPGYHPSVAAAAADLDKTPDYGHSGANTPGYQPAPTSPAYAEAYAPAPTSPAYQPISTADIQGLLAAIQVLDLEKENS